MLILPTWGGVDCAASGQTLYRLGTASKILLQSVTEVIKYYTSAPYFGAEILVGEVLPQKRYVSDDG